MTRTNAINGENSTLFTNPQISVLLWLCDKGGLGVFLLSIKSKSSITEYCSGVSTSIIMIILIDDLIATITYKNCTIKNHCLEALPNSCGRIGELLDGSAYIPHVRRYTLYL